MVRFCFREWCPESARITVRFAQESLSGLNKNQCPLSARTLSGISRNQCPDWTRICIVTTIGLFFLFSSPKQNIRLDLGNRPQFIKASYDCRINQNLSDSEKEAACEEYQLLKEMDIFGYYPEGLSDTEFESIREDYLKNR